MKQSLKTALLLLSLGGFTGCGRDYADNTDGANDAAGTADPYKAREVSGVWLLSTDYNYDERCNYLPVEFVQSLFKLPEGAELEKHDLPKGCEVRWEGGKQKVGFYFESNKPYESVFQSEWAFDKLYQPRKVAAMDSATLTPGVKLGSYHGPNPEGTGAERPAEGHPGGAPGADASAANDSSNQPTPNKTPAQTRLVDPAQNTATAEAVANVGDKALWEPRKRVLHVLHLNHIINIQAPRSGSLPVARQGAIGLAQYLIGHMFDKEA